MDYEKWKKGAQKLLAAIKEDVPKDEEAVLVCGLKRETHFTDNVYRECEGCGAEIMHRPHLPDVAKLKFLCPDCAFVDIERAKAEGEEVEVHATKKTKEEVLDWIERGGPDD